MQIYAYWKANTKDGPVTAEEKRTEVFIKLNSQWTLIGGQGTPDSPKDAEPYKKLAPDSGQF